MAPADELLELLRCPLDGGPLAPAGERLACAAGHEHPVRDGIPRFSGDAMQDATAHSFGSKWDAVRDEDKPRISAFQFRWYDQRYGWGDEAGLAAQLAAARRVLDAGCGLGYDAARYARLTDGLVVGLDLTRSVEIAARDHGGAANLRFVQGDLTAPPFAPGSFDFVVADQVIHHTPDCPAAFATLARLLAPGGQLSVYVYKRKGLIRELADDAIRARTTAMPVQECLEFSEQMTELGRALSGLHATVTLERGVPLLGIPAGEHDVQRLVYWHFLKCFYNEELGEHQSTMGNFDWYHPPYASRHTEEEVRAWCAEARLDIVALDVADGGISVRAARP